MVSMNSNVGLFDEEHNLTLDDMGWNVDSMFSSEGAQDSEFDLTKATQDFFGGLQTSLEMVAAPVLEQESNDEQISPRGIMENVEQHSSSRNAKGSPGNSEPPRSSGSVKQLDSESLFPSSPPSQNDSEPDQNENFFANEKDSPKTPAKEQSPAPPELVASEAASPTANTNRQSATHEEPYQAQQTMAPDVQVSTTREELNAALCTQIPFTLTDRGNECHGTGYGPGNPARDPLESLVNLPGYIQFNGELDPILDLHSTPEKAGEGDDTLQNFLNLQGQVPHPDLTASPNEAVLQGGLAPNDLVTNYETSLLYQPEPQHDDRQNRVFPIPDASPLQQDQAVSPEQGYMSSALGMHLDNQTIQEVVQAYQSNMQPHLQSQTQMDYGPPAHSLSISYGGPNASASMQPSFTHFHRSSAGPSHALPVRSTEGIVKRGRRKSVRDPTKPPLTPKWKKAHSPRSMAGEQNVTVTPDSIPSGAFQSNYATNPAARPSVTVAQHCVQSRPSPSGIPSSSTRGGASRAPVSENRLASAVNSNAAGTSSAKGPLGFESGRIMKKSGRKGGRVNPETAHLSVEERRSLRAKRNRESAEKSRVRRKEQTAELEMSVAELRNENKSLKSEVLRFQGQLSKTTMEITQHTTSPAEREQFLQEHTPALFHAMVVLQGVINQCPRTFRTHPHSPEIQLKIRR